jgi:DNA-binding CsgD family transcriptional regulator
VRGSIRLPPMKTAGSKQQVPVVPFADAFILYRPRPNRTSDQFSYTPEAYRILAPKALPSHDGPTRNGMTTSPDLPALCTRWMQLLDNRAQTSSSADGDEELPAGVLDLYHSGRRQYIVMGRVLSNGPTKSRRRAADGDCHYLFILERASFDRPQLSRMLREWHLSHREQEIVRLLLEDKSNQEIATSLNLSIYTVKTHLKSLMRKLGVGSRAGVISCLFTSFFP